MEIQLTGKNKGIAIVSQEDYDTLSKYSWHKDNEGYIQGHVNGSTMRMHRFIMNAKFDQQIDHINGIRHDNRRMNLRSSSTLINGQNKKKKKGISKSKYRGITLLENGTYHAKITLDGVIHNLGNHKTEQEAVEAWDMFVLHTGLTHIMLQLPEKREEYLSREYKPYIPRKSEFVGLELNATKTRYVATICVNKKRMHIGSHPDKIEAAKIYDDYIVSNNILNKKLNFPDRHPEYGKDKPILTKCVEIDSTTIKLIVTSKNDKSIIIDKEDYEKVKHYSCYIDVKGYVRIEIGTKTMRLHRYLLGITDPNNSVDHIDNDKLNNKKNNLRTTTTGKNNQNRRKQTNTLSKYIGVSYQKKKWQSYITNDKQRTFCGLYSDEETAARARDLYILENFKDEHYKLNFKWSTDDIIFWKNKLFKPKKILTSSYIGVSLCKLTKQWKCQVEVKNKTLMSKTYKLEEHAARARDLYITIHLSDNKRFKLNFEWNKTDIEKWKTILKIN